MAAPHEAHEFFRDPAWLDAHGVVEPHTVEEYFSGSHFYDRTCLNEQWRVQGVRPSDELLARSSGIEYRLTHLRPPYLYVIRKEQRRADRDPRSLCSYYILDGTIFQAPTVEDVVTSRMAKCIYHLRQALSCVRA